MRSVPAWATPAQLLVSSNYLALTESGRGEIRAGGQDAGDDGAVTWKRDGSGLYVNAIGAHWLSISLAARLSRR
jgi:hypothetical protein